MLFQYIQEKHNEEKSSKPQLLIFCGAYWTTRATWYLSGIAYKQYRCLNRVFILIFEYETNTKSNKVSGGGDHIQRYSTVRPQKRREWRRRKVGWWKFGEREAQERNCRMDRSTPQTALEQRGRGRWWQRRRCWCFSSLNIIWLPRRRRRWRSW